MVALLEEMMEATGGTVVVPCSKRVAAEGLLSGPGRQKVRDEADWAVVVLARAAAATVREWRIVEVFGGLGLRLVFDNALHGPRGSQ